MKALKLTSIFAHAATLSLARITARKEIFRRNIMLLLGVLLPAYMLLNYFTIVINIVLLLHNMRLLGTDLYMNIRLTKYI